MQSFRTVKQCRVCGNAELIRYLDLGKMPPADAFVKQPNAKEEFFPLEVQYCTRCSLSQLTIVVDPKIMFSEYCYRSSVSKPFHDHCLALAEVCREWLGVQGGELVVDIASNDGCLLTYFKQQGFRVLGIEPAVNIARIANQAGISTINEFWDVKVAREIRVKYGPARIITGTNIFAHVDDVGEFLEAVRYLLDDQGILIFEFPHAAELINKAEYDTIYHEHLSYFLLKPILRLFEAHQMQVFDVEKISIHGGSLRLFAQKTAGAGFPVTSNLQKLQDEEEQGGFYDLEVYRWFATRVYSARKDLMEFFARLKMEGKSVIGYGAAAKGNTLLNFCGLGPDHILFIVDDTPEKQHLLTPGRHIPIKDSSALRSRRFDYMLILAWNYKEEIINKTKTFSEQGGRYIIPIPKVTVV